MSATVYGQQLSKLGLGDRTVQSSTTDGDQRGYVMNVDGQTDRDGRSPREQTTSRVPPES